jgi:hypothetical protein
MFGSKLKQKMLDEKKFRLLTLAQRLQLLKHKGIYLGARESFAHYVYLYSLESCYVEAYRLKTLNQFQHIEIQKSKEIIQEYLKEIKLDIPDNL